MRALATKALFIALAFSAPCGAAISRIASQDAKAASTTSVVVATYPVTATISHLLIATAFAGVLTSNITISGWTVIVSTNNATTRGTIMFAKVSDGTEQFITANATGAANFKLHIYEYTGNNGIVTDGTNGNISGAATTLNSNSITTTNASDLIFVAFGLGGNVSLPSCDSSFNTRQADANIRLFDCDQIVAATGSYSTTGSWTTSTPPGAIIAAFQASGGGVITATPLRTLMGVGL